MRTTTVFVRVTNKGLSLDFAPRTPKKVRVKYTKFWAASLAEYTKTYAISVTEYNNTYDSTWRGRGNAKNKAAICDSAWAKHNKTCDSAWEKHNKACQSFLNSLLALRKTPC